MVKSYLLIQSQSLHLKHMDHAIYFYLNPIYVLKSITKFLFYLESMATGAITVFEKMWKMIN